MKKRRRRIRRLRRRNPFGKITNLALGGAEASMAIGMGTKLSDMFK